MPRHPRLPAARLLVLAASAGAVVRVLGQSAPPVLPPAAALAAAEPAVAPAGGAAGARDAGPAEAGGLSMAKADACVVELDGDGNVVGLEMAGTGKVLAVGAKKARTVNAKKFARDFATPVPTAVLTGLNGAGAAEHAAFAVEAVAFSKRRGEGKVLVFETQQTPSQARQNGPGLGDSSSTVALGACSLVIDGAALGTTATARWCPLGKADFGDGCVVACPAGQVVSASGDTCVAQKCCYSDTICAEDTVCPGGTAVSAECADRSAFNESPCACTALQQLAARSTTLQAEAPWSALASAAYCQTGGLYVECATVDGVQLPTLVFSGDEGAGLAGALPPSLGELGPSLTSLDLSGNAISSLPTELGALTGLADLDLTFNDLTSLPTDIGALTGLTYLELSSNALTSVPTELGALTGLKYLAAESNDLTSLPPELAALTGLDLDLSYNRLTGVPTEFRGTGLDLGSNAITSLPTELGALTGLALLDLDFNAITSVPTELAALTGLTELDLQNNQLTGVPTEFRTWGPSSTCYLFDNPGFSCANVGAGTSCCTANNCPGGTSTCYSG